MWFISSHSSFLGTSIKYDKPDKESSEGSNGDSIPTDIEPGIEPSIKKRLRLNPSPSKRYTDESQLNRVSIPLARESKIPVVKLDRSATKSHIKEKRKTYDHIPKVLQYGLWRIQEGGQKTRKVICPTWSYVKEKFITWKMDKHGFGVLSKIWSVPWPY